MSDVDLTQEANRAQVRKYINGLRQDLAKEQLLRKEDQEKWFNESQQRKLVEQRLTEKELLLQRKNERIEYLEHSLNALQKKLEDLEHSIKDRSNSSFGFFKIFNGKENEQVKLQMKEYEEELEIKTDEIERLHVQVFELKKDIDRKEEFYERQINEAKQDYDKLVTQYQQLNTQCNNLQSQLKESENQLQERQNKLDEYLILLKAKEENILQFKEIQNKQQMTMNEMNQSLKKFQQQLTDQNKEIKLMQDITQFVREFMKNMMTSLESHQELKGNVIEVQDVMKSVKAFYENKFTADIDKERRKTLLRNEQAISNEILHGHLRTSLRLEKQNGKVIQVNSVLDDAIGLDLRTLEVYERAKEKILKMGKINEQLEKKNKVLTDKLTVQQETKKNYQN